MLKVVAYMKGRTGSLKEHLKSHLLRMYHFNLAIFWQDVHENSKDPHSVIEPSKIFASCSVEFDHYYTTKPSQNLTDQNINVPINFWFEWNWQILALLSFRYKKEMDKTCMDATEKILQWHVSKIKKPP